MFLYPYYIFRKEVRERGAKKKEEERDQNVGNKIFISMLSQHRSKEIVN